MQGKGKTYEIILVNDCSPDNVWETIKNIAKENERVIGISMSKNFGQHSALMAGYRQSKGDIVVSMDDDGQTPADEMFNLIDKIGEGYDVVYASYENKMHSGFRNFGSKMNDIMTEQMLGKPKGLRVSSYFAARRFVINEVCKYKRPYTYILGLVFQCTRNITNVPVKHRARMVGQSGYTFGKLINLWLNGFTAFSIKPLRMATASGVFFAILGFLYALYVLIHKFTHPEVMMGWSSLISAIFILGGLILCMLGMIGEYLGRMYISINDAPQYVIKETVGTDNEQ